MAVDFMQIGTTFDEYPYISGMAADPYVCYPIVVEGIWWLDGRVYSIEEIGTKCSIPEDELMFMKLKYGG